MRRELSIILSISALLLLPAKPALSQDLWVAKDGSLRNVDARAMAVDRNRTYLATSSQVYRADSEKEKWEPVFSVPSVSNQISCVAAGGNVILVGTTRGIFRSQDGGKTWSNTFRTILPDKSNIHSMEISRTRPGAVVVGTEKGVFLSDDLGNKWRDISANLKNKRIASIALNKDSVYASGEGGLYTRRNDCTGWDRIRVNSPAGTDPIPNGAEEALAQEEPEANRAIGCVAFKGSRLYAGIEKDIVYSDNDGKSWQAFSSSGIRGSISYILISEKSDRMYCSTSKGVFEFQKDGSRWRELYRGLDKASSVRKIIFDGDNESSLWSLTDKGLYKLDGGCFSMGEYLDVERGLGTMKVIFDKEPTFRQLQQAALKFAELSPEKITSWRNQARLKALMPKLSVGLDKNVSTNAEIYTSATKEFVTVGPDDITDGIDLSVSWDLGSIIWSDDQTNIDVRSRLTTQLRNDVLDDLRRAYYERKRLQWELITDPPQDPKAKFEKELRVQELGNNIDDLTGNYLTDHTRQ